LLLAALREALSAGISVTHADFEVFRPAGATRCTDGAEIVN